MPPDTLVLEIDGDGVMAQCSLKRGRTRERVNFTAAFTGATLGELALAWKRIRTAVSSWEGCRGEARLVGTVLFDATIP